MKYKIISSYNFQYKYENIVEFIESPKSYVYVFLDTSKKGTVQYGEYKFEYQPFYVGKGTFDRCDEHFKNII